MIPNELRKRNRYLLKLADYIEHHPSEFAMNTVAANTYCNGNICGTVGCIAGQCLLHSPRVKFVLSKWSDDVMKKAFKRGYVDEDNARVLLDGLDASGNWLEAAQDLLGIDNLTAEQLFYTSKEQSGYHWPEPFDSRYVKAQQPRTRAKIAAQRIRHFVKTGR